MIFNLSDNLYKVYVTIGLAVLFASTIAIYEYDSKQKQEQYQLLQLECEALDDRNQGSADRKLEVVRLRGAMIRGDRGSIILFLMMIMVASGTLAGYGALRLRLILLKKSSDDELLRKLELEKMNLEIKKLKLPN